jgi:alpha-galactosidase
MEPVGNQGHTYGIAFWMPFYGTGTGRRVFDPYYLRSTLCPHFTACFDMRLDHPDLDVPRRILGQWRHYADCYFGDYYPLTEYSLSEDVWMAWQFHRPDLGKGVVQAFRRSESAYESARFPLSGLGPDTLYLVEDLDSGTSQRITGRELMEAGLLVRLPACPAAGVVIYEKAE